MYDSVRPPPFASQEVMDVSRVREREKEYTPQKLKEELESSSRRRFSRSQINGSIFISQRVKDKKNDDQNNLTPNNKCDEDDQKLESVRITPSVKGSRRFSVCGKPRLEGGIYTSRPSLFLQEVTHLLSLLMAVALSTLRNDSDGIELPLVEYEHGSEFPPVDPDSLSSYERKKFYGESRLLTCLTFVFGADRTTEQRVLYNAARPFGVLGGVSDSEMLLLKSCKGPSSKVVLCSMWLMEFISREYLAGSVGNVAPPIVSRLYQEISNGKLGFQQARKIAFVPFPFPHSQLVTFFNLVILWVVPFLAYSFVDNMPLACAINFLTISIFVSLHEVARELENPFQNVPNDLPLCTYMAHFNEALISTYSGFHPDSWWELPQNYQDRDDHIAISRRRSGDI